MSGTTATDRKDSGRDQAVGPPSTSRRLTAEERRSQLFDEALSLFAERGYAATTMDDIAEAAGVTKPLVYQHFDSKRALYLELLDVFSRALVDHIAAAVDDAEGPRQQVEVGMAAYFEMMVDNEHAFRLIYGRDAPDDPELGEALRRVEDTIAQAIDPLIDAGLEPEHRLLLAYSVVGMVEGASRLWLGRDVPPITSPAEGGGTSSISSEASVLASRVADLAWAGLRQVHRD